MGYAQERVREYWIHNSFKTILSLILLMILSVMLRENLLALIVIFFLWLADILFSILLRFFLRPIYAAAPLGFEMVTFNTVVVALVFGPIAGIIAGILFGTTYYGIVFDFQSRYQLINIPMYGVIGYLAAVISTSSIVSLGIILSLLYGILTSFFIILIFAGRPGKCLVFIVSNVLFNYWLFTNISSIVLNIIAL